jgi:hypothetical protein
MDVKLNKNYIQNHQNRDHKYNTVLHIGPLNISDVEK